MAVHSGDTYRILREDGRLTDVRLWGADHLGTVRATLSAAMVFSTGIAPAVLGIALDLGASFTLVLAGMLALLIAGWLLAQGVLASPEARGA